VKKCKVISYGRMLKPIQCEYFLNEQPLERVKSMNDLGVILDEKLNFVEHVDMTVSKARRMLGFIMRVAKEFNDPYTLKCLYVTYVRSKLESACCVWNPFYEVHLKKIERVQSKFIRYALRRLGWTDMNDLPPYECRCVLLNLETLRKRRTISAAMFVRDLLCAKIDSPNLLMKIKIAACHYQTRSQILQFIYLNTNRTNYGSNAPFNTALSSFNSFFHVFDFCLSRQGFKALLRSAL
jgi:hypothetical protein